MIESQIIRQLLFDLFVILSAGLVAGTICKRLRMPMVVGYLFIGALIGSGMLGLLKTSEDTAPVAKSAPITIEASAAELETDVVKTEMAASGEKADKVEEEQIVIETQQVERRVLDQFAHLGANLLLFAIGLQFSPSELGRLWRFFLVGGLIQMLGVIVPLGLFFHLIGADWRIGIVLGSAVSLSSTVLVYKSLEDMGQASAPHGVRAVAILLFQDVAVVPLLVLVNLFSSMVLGATDGQNPLSELALLGFDSIVFLGFAALVRYVFYRYGVSILLGFRSVELMVLFTMVLLIGVSMVAFQLKLPGAIGALAVGVILSETRVTNQITAITVAMRETFSAIFFVSLGALFDPAILFSTPVLTLASLLGCLVLKTLAAGVAFRVLGLRWIQALAMGLGLSQLGELSFVLLSQGVSNGLFDYETYQRVLFVALTSIILTPLFLKIALNAMPEQHVVHDEHHGQDVLFPEDAMKRALVVGLGPIGGRVATFLESSGFDVGLIDMNPVNLHPFAQQGFRTISGNSADESVLRLIDIHDTTLVVLAIPDDVLAMETVASIRSQNDRCVILSRCRYLANVEHLDKAGANLVVCGETELGNSLIRSVRKLLR